MQSLCLEGACLIWIEEVWIIWKLQDKFLLILHKTISLMSHLKDQSRLIRSCLSVTSYDHDNNSSLLCHVQDKSWCQALGRKNSVISTSEKIIQKWNNFLISCSWYLTFSEYWLLFFFFFSLPHKNAIRHAVNYSYISSGWLREWKKWLFLDEKCHGNIHWVILMLDYKHYVFSFHIFKRMYSLHPH